MSLEAVVSAVRNTLESRGVLAKLRADLRLAVFTAIDAKERENAQLLVGLMADFCDSLGLPTTRSCLLAETGMPAEAVPLRGALQSEFAAAVTSAGRAGDAAEDARVYSGALPLLLHITRAARHASTQHATIASESTRIAAAAVSEPPRAATGPAPAAAPQVIDIKTVVDVDYAASPRLSPAHASPMNASSASSDEPTAQAAPAQTLSIQSQRDSSAFFARGGNAGGMEYHAFAGAHDVSEASASGIDVSSSIEVGSPSDALRRSSASAARAAALPPMPALTAAAGQLPTASDSVYSASTTSDVLSQAQSGSASESRVGFVPTPAEAPLPGGVSSITKSLGLGSDLFRLARDLHDAADNDDAAAAVLAAHSHDSPPAEAHASPAKNADDLDAELEALLAAGLEGDAPPPPPPRVVTAAVPVAAAAMPPPPAHMPSEESSSFSESSPLPAVTRAGMPSAASSGRGGAIMPLAGTPARDRSSATYGDEEDEDGLQDDDDDVRVSRHALKAASAAITAQSPAKMRPAPAAPASPPTADDSYGYDEDFEGSDAEGGRRPAPAPAPAAIAPAPELPASPRAESIAEELEEDIVVEDDDVPPAVTAAAAAAVSSRANGADVQIFPFTDAADGELFARGTLEVAKGLTLDAVHALLAGASTAVDLD